MEEFLENYGYVKKIVIKYITSTFKIKVKKTSLYML